MYKEKLIIRLDAQADVIKTNVNRLKKSSYNISLLDVDLLRQKTIEFYDHILELELLINENMASQKKDSFVSESLTEEIDQEELVIVEEHEIIEKDETIINESVIPDEPEVVAESKIIESQLPDEELESFDSESLITPETSVETEKELIVDEIIENKEIDQNQSQQTTYDLFSENSESPVAERFQTSKEPNIAERMQKTAITNIREAIGINDKFLFINELFNGDLGRYNKILDDLQLVFSNCIFLNMDISHS